MNSTNERTKSKSRSTTSSTRSLQVGSTRPSSNFSKSLKTPTVVQRGPSKISSVASTNKNGIKRRPNSLQPLCQRSQQRHEIFRMGFEQKLLDNNSCQGSAHEGSKCKTRKSVVPRSIAGGSLPPRLPSVKNSTTLSAKPTQRKQWFPKPSPEAAYRPRSVREKAAKEKFLQQPGARLLLLSPPIGSTPAYESGFDPISPTVYTRGASCGAEGIKCQVKNPKSRWYAVHGNTPPAEADADSEQFDFGMDKWHASPSYNRPQTKFEDKQQYRLKSQQLQVQKMKNVYKTRHYDINYQEVDSPLALYDRGEEECDYA